MVKGRLNRESNPVPGEKPGFLPQHESTVSGEFVVTGERNPYPVKVKNTDEQAIPVQLTGSIVGEQKIATDLIVTVGSKTTIATLDTSNYKEVGLRVQRKDTSGDSAQNIAFYMQLGFPGILYMDGFDVEIPLINERESMLNYRAITMMVEVDAPKIVFKLENKGNSDHIYDVWLVYKTR